MKSYEWKLRSGQTARIEAEYKEEIHDVVIDADGFEIRTGRKELYRCGKIAAYVDGKKVEWNRIFGSEDFRLVDIKDGLKRIKALNKIGFTAENAVEVEVFLKDVVKSGQTAETIAFAEAETAEFNKRLAEEEIEHARYIVKTAERQKDIPTAAEAERRMKNYNNAVNEGGDGYVPYIVNAEEYARAKEILKGE